MHPILDEFRREIIMVHGNSIVPHSQPCVSPDLIRTDLIGKAVYRCASVRKVTEVVMDIGISVPLPADLVHAEAAPLFASGPQTASLFQGWRYSSPRIRVGVCRGHQRVCQPAYVSPQLACWRVCCVAFAR
jgi:hypothetical protein